MLEILSKEIPVKFENGQLQTVTNEIMKHSREIRRSFYQIAHLLNEVETNRLFVDDGFMSTVEYAEKTFGFKKTLCYNLLNIGQVYTAENGKESNLPHDKSKDYTSSQLKVMLPYDEEQVRELADTEEITPYMTVSALKKRLKGLQEEEEQETATEGAESLTDAGEEESPTCPYLFEIKAYTGEDGTIYIESNGDVPDLIASAVTSFINMNL